MIVVADTSPLNYLILIQHIDALPALYGEVIVPPAVREEMLDPMAPPSVRAWISRPPQWLEVRTPGTIEIAFNTRLDDGEREAITLAYTSGTDVSLLIDERAGRDEAERLGLKITGTLGVLLAAHHNRLLDLHEAVRRLRETSFSASDLLIESFLKLG